MPRCYTDPLSEPSCPGCQKRDAIIAELLERIKQLEQRVRDREAQLNTTSCNSSTPPAANPAAAPKPVVKKRTGRQPGSQRGHPAHLRRRLPTDRVQHTVPFVPGRCAHCHSRLPRDPGPDGPPPTWHQVAELPQTAAVVTEYQGHFRTCPGGGACNHAPLPAALRASCVGPNLAAFLAYLAGRHHLSKRGLEELAEEVCDVPLALGTVANLEAPMSQALETPHAEALEAVRQARVKHLDETSWKLAGRRRWLWLAATTTVACFFIQARRSGRALRALVGEAIIGYFCSDRWAAYDRLPVRQRQLCWAHTIRTQSFLALLRHRLTGPRSRGGAARRCWDQAFRLQPA